MNDKGEFAVTLDDIKHFRQLDSKTPGHPEYRLTAGVETTTGPLGQGVANSVGMAIAGKWLASAFQSPRFRDLQLQRLRHMRRRRHDGRHLAAKPRRWPDILKLSNLCWIYDNNHITLDGRADLVVHRGCGDALRRLTAGMFSHVTDANDLEMLAKAYNGFLQTNDRPTLDSSSIATSATALPTSRTPAPPTANRWAKKKSGWSKKFYGWPEDAKFLVPDGVLRDTSATASANAVANCAQKWETQFCGVRQRSFRSWPIRLTACSTARLPDGWDKNLPTFPADAKGMATRESSGKVLNVVAQNVPWLMGGSADLCPLHQTAAEVRRCRRFRSGQLWRTQLPLRRPRTRHGRGLERHGVSKIRAFGRTFFIFSDYMRPPSVWPRSWKFRSSTFSPTIPSASAKTARPISRSNNWRRCGRCPD